MVDRPKPYTSGELVRMAVELIPFDPLRVVATYANPDNWAQLNANQRCYWSWVGPVIVGYELADNAFKFGARHVAPPEPVVLTPEEERGFRIAVNDCLYGLEGDAAMGWFAANGFALVRTKAVADGA